MTWLNWHRKLEHSNLHHDRMQLLDFGSALVPLYPKAGLDGVVTDRRYRTLYQSLCWTRPTRGGECTLTCIVTNLSSTITSLVRKSAPIYIMIGKFQCILYRIASHRIRLGSLVVIIIIRFVCGTSWQRRGAQHTPVKDRGTWMKWAQAASTLKYSPYEWNPQSPCIGCWSASGHTDS